MRWLALLAVVASCSKRDAAPPPASGSAANVDAVRDAQGSAALADAALGSAATPPALEGIAVPIASHPCGSANLDDCELPNIAVDAQPVTVRLADCTLASALELRTLDQYTKRCAIALRQTGAVTIADTLSPCSSWDAEHQKWLPRVHIDRASCTGDVIDIYMSTTRVQCRRSPGDGIACVREARLDAGGAKLAALLADVKRVVEAHQWRALLELCASEHRKAQIGEMHQDIDTYLAEILGLHSVGNSLSDGRVTKAALDRIERITYVEIVDDNDGWFSIIGIVSLKGHPDLRLELRATASGARFVLSGALG